MCLTVSSLLGIFGSVMVHTIGRQHLSHNDSVAYYTLRNLTYFVEAILGTIGLVQLTRQFMQVPEEPSSESDASSPRE